jgi:HEAT repeat protein
MKLSLPLKLGIAVVAAFALLIISLSIYRPLRFRWLQSRLQSADAGVREKTIKSIASEGSKAIPYIRRWLMSENNALGTGSCRALAEMKGDTWKAALKELERILDGPPSELTDTVASILEKEPSTWIYNRSPGHAEIEWKKYKKHPARRRNILCYILSHCKEKEIRGTAAYNLGELWDTQAVERLLSLLNDEEVRNNVVHALGEIGDSRALEPLMNAFLAEEDSGNLWNYAYALGKINNPDAVKPLLACLGKAAGGDTTRDQTIITALGELCDLRAVEPLIDILKNHSVRDVRIMAAMALGKIGNANAVPALKQSFIRDSEGKFLFWPTETFAQIGNDECADILCEITKTKKEKSFWFPMPVELAKTDKARASDLLLQIMENTKDKETRDYVARGLAEIPDQRFYKVLIASLDNITHDLDGFHAAMALTQYPSEETRKALLKAQKDGATGAEFALLWLYGPDGIETMGDPMIVEFFCSLENYRYLAYLRWGDLDMLDMLAVLHQLPTPRPLIAELLKRMPDGFPEYDPYAKYAKRKKQCLKIKRWLSKHMHRFAWDKNKQRYYLEAEKNN